MKKAFISNVNSLITLIMSSSINRPFLVFGREDFELVRAKLKKDDRRKYHFSKFDKGIYLIFKTEDYDWELGKFGTEFFGADVTALGDDIR